MNFELDSHLKLSSEGKTPLRLCHSMIYMPHHVGKYAPVACEMFHGITHSACAIRIEGDDHFGAMFRLCRACS
jgi:hypothetical protein